MQDDLISLEEITRLTGADPKFVVLTLDRDGVRPIRAEGSWIDRHKPENLRRRRSEIEAWLRRQTRE